MTSILTLLQDPRARIASLAGLTLLVELALIRWMASNVFHLGFFANFILLACFLGIGLGFLIARREQKLFVYSPLPLFAVMAFTLLARVELAVPDTGSVIFVGLFAAEEQQVIPAPLFLAVVFVGIVTTFAMISQETARSFPKLEPLKAYTWDIAGSLTGIVLFTIMSALWFPSWAWFGLGALLWGVLIWGSDGEQKRKRASLVALFAVVALSSNPDTLIHTDRTIWSPYQMLTAFVNQESPEEVEVFANRIHHQTIRPLHMKEVFRTTPYEVAEKEGVKIERALIVGAGSGVDVAVAIDEGVQHIDAAELDPAIAGLAKQFNPHKPYDDPKVNLIVNDGRHVLQQAKEPYDLVVFALPDSLALYSSQSNVRLESFLFTEESFIAARDALDEDGIFALYNFYWNPAIVDRIAATLEKVFGHPPKVSILDDRFFAVLVIGPKIKGKPLEFAEPEKVEELPTDDWPFLYLMGRTIPTLYIIPLLLLLLFSALAVWRLAPRDEGASAGPVKWPLFFMGAAFLLLETKSIIQFSLLFGATWLVNSLVFAGVLAMVLVANFLVMWRRPKRLWPWYIALAAALFVGWYVPWSAFMGIESVPVRYLAACTVLFLPIMIANVIFAGTFAMSEASDIAFGWNLLGTMVGGAAEYTSMMLGYRNLAIVVALLYGLALVTFLVAKRKTGSSDS